MSARLAGQSILSTRIYDRSRSTNWAKDVSILISNLVIPFPC
jgi:hypothetical protein